jgi:hypothetical protein
VLVVPSKGGFRRNQIRGPFGLSWLRWFFLTFALWGVSVAFTLYEAMERAQDGESALRSVADSSDLAAFEDLDIDALEDDLDAGGDDLAQAHRLLDSPVLVPLRPFPFVGRQIASARALASAGDDVVGRLRSVVSQVALARRDPNAIDQVAFLSSLSADLDGLDDSLRVVDLGPEEGLVAPLSEARAEFRDRLDDLALDVAPLTVITRGMAAFLDDSTYLVLGANPAEMRLAGGMPLSVGQLEIEDGEFILPSLTPSNDLFPVSGVAVIDDDIEARWGFLSPSNDYRKLGYSARFADWSAPQAALMWEAQQGVAVDGVIQVDPFLLQALLRVTGPMVLDDERFDADSILQYLLIDQYDQFAEVDDTIQSARRDRLSVVAAAVVAELGRGAWDPLELLSALRPVASGRHVMAFSRDPIQQAAWDELGVSGRLGGDEVGVFVLNQTASKQDPYIAVDVVATVTTNDDSRSIQLDIAVTNNSPPDLSDFAAGNWEYLGLQGRGSYQGLLTIYAPGFADGLRFSQPRVLQVFGRDGEVQVMATGFELQPGATLRVQVTFDVAIEATTLEVVPSTRLGGQRWTVGTTTQIDTEARSLPIDES